MILIIFESWKNCIVNDCNIKLIVDFVNSCLKVYNNKCNLEIKKFIFLYGE